MIGDSDRDWAVTELREHFARGRLTLEEFSNRADRALAARSRNDLRRALRGLPATSDELLERGRAVVHAVGRGVALVAFTGAYLLFSFVLVLVLALTLLIHGASTHALLALLVVWLVPTYLLSRMWHSRPGR